jgi:hypothetical protein
MTSGAGGAFFMTGVRAATGSGAASPGLGERASTAQASRWRRIGTCESQQVTEQKLSSVRTRLHVETLQVQ